MGLRVHTLGTTTVYRVSLNLSHDLNSNLLAFKGKWKHNCFLGNDTVEDRSCFDTSLFMKILFKDRRVKQEQKKGSRKEHLKRTVGVYTYFFVLKSRIILSRPFWC